MIERNDIDGIDTPEVGLVYGLILSVVFWVVFLSLAAWFVFVVLS